jgi:hypothetical protein
VATYYDIFGQKVQYLASDPANLTEGQVWYNSTSNTAKVQGFQAAAWSTGGSLNTARTAGQASGGTYLAAFTAQGGPSINATENYDGSTWTASGNTNTPGYRAGNGTQTAGLAVGGSNGVLFYNNTEEYNGSTWTSVPATIAAPSQLLATLGTQTATLRGGGTNPGTGIQNTAQTYDGTNWTTITSLPSPRHSNVW